MTSDTAEEEEDPAFEDLSRLPIVQFVVKKHFACCELLVRCRCRYRR